MTGDMKDFEQKAAVFGIWLVFGLIGTALVFDGLAHDNLITGGVGTALLLAGLIGHIIANHVFGRGFSQAEAALGLALFSLAGLSFLAAWVMGALSSSDFYLGLGSLGALVVGFIAYATTRFGAAGAFSRYDVTSVAETGK